LLSLWSLQKSQTNFDHGLLRDIEACLGSISGKLYHMGFRGKYALDSTTIDLCLSLFPWAKFRQHKAAVKMHTLPDFTTWPGPRQIHYFQG